MVDLGAQRLHLIVSETNWDVFNAGLTVDVLDAKLDTAQELSLELPVAPKHGKSEEGEG